MDPDLAGNARVAPPMHPPDPQEIQMHLLIGTGYRLEPWSLQTSVNCEQHTTPSDVWHSSVIPDMLFHR